jgi:hypothetical protein
MREAEHHKMQQIKFVMMACAIGYLGGASNWLMWYGIHVPPYPSISISLYVTLIAYAIFRHRLMDFNLVLRWGIAYAILMACFILVVAPLIIFYEKLSQSYLHSNPGISTLLTICLLVLIFDPLKKKITKFVDQIVFQSPDFQLILNNIEIAIEESKNIQDLSLALSEKLKKIWLVDHSGLALWSFDHGSYQFLPDKEFASQIIKKMDLSIGKTDFLVKTLETERRLFSDGVILEDEINLIGEKSFPGEKMTFWKMRRTMRWLGASACIPLMQKKDLLGFIIMGKKKNSGAYNAEDKKFLTHVAEKIAAATNNLIINDSQFRQTEI